MLKLICLLFVQFLVHNAIAQGTYRAAVVEYAPKLTAPKIEDRLLENVREYLNLIEQASEKKVQIIVFPEDGLTGWAGITDDTVDGLSTEVPDPDEKISPCTTPKSHYSQYFLDLSCAAKTHGIYTAVNLIEREYDNNAKKNIYHNTNVVFDSNGTVIARFRKINLLNEPVFVPGNSTVTFKTDFGVTFGMFVCFDIMFKNPALDVLSDPAVTDIVFSAAWFSHLPFYGALTIQDGYVRSNGINLLASSYDGPAEKNGGGGIYFADGRREVFISGTRSTKMIIQDVPKISKRNPPPSCQEPPQQNVDLGNGNELPDVSDFHSSIDDLSNFTFKSLDLNQREIDETICNGDNFCCSFKIIVNKDANVEPNYVYKLAAHYGVSQLIPTKSLGLRNCVLVACLNETDSTCGGRHKELPRGVTFENILVKGKFNPKTTHPQPIALKGNLRAANEYRYCKNTVNDEVEIQMATTKRQDSLLVFGLYGRVFSYDDRPGGVINSE